MSCSAIHRSKSKGSVLPRYWRRSGDVGGFGAIAASDCRRDTGTGSKRSGAFRIRANRCGRLGTLSPLHTKVP